ncbi:hypothetical protein METBIDRAFT_79271 [Metschnikowia bicuspidata var. bicuspidata NRRL YB-4993]|uniref:Uncharacterized protein n=1 Tax=Metschnikowia bicuspidata var. bicuspidata NRRL YB-4993 TaxID=869754 RepID=A0A1A0H7S2_9ASCO|nr:hypothetical protein METBIDRAFT_79271 [Metschnikowia bicuspidata var. bicuspidata NRRL YB-4993]OBA19948.1 hypothetical protein METBIDRAFT_79271 [Metschnikowia bicuspidata var. bicuspidata NRRL YB-4993]
MRNSLYTDNTCFPKASYFNAGPTFFNDPEAVPLQYNASKTSDSRTESTNTHEESANSLTNKRPAKELTSLIAMTALAYLALDNYQGRVRAEKLNQETTAINLKTLQIQLQNYIKARQQQDLRMLKERVEVSKRCFKMSMHIALLRKQLMELGADPKDIPDVTKEFDKHAKVSNSVQNLTGNAIWLTDESEYKGLMPDYREYDRKS